MLDEVFDLQESKKLTGLGIERLRQMVVAGELVAFQPGGKLGKWFIPRSEIERLRTPIVARRAA